MSEHLSLTSLRFLQGLLNQQSIAVNSPELLVGAQNAARAKDELAAAIEAAQLAQLGASVDAQLQVPPAVPLPVAAESAPEDGKADSPAVPEAAA